MSPPEMALSIGRYKPTILVVNQYSLSYAEDYTEGYGTLKLGELVGEPTVGGIIYTGSMELVDGPVMRTPGAGRDSRLRKAAYPLLLALALLFALVRAGTTTDLAPFRFVILGDRTGDTVAGVYEQAWQAAASKEPAFVVTVGDIIEGGNDATAKTEWREVERILQPYKRFPLYLTAGNHDIWSPVSERLFEEHAAHPRHYSFDYGQAHFTVLDNSRSDEFPAGEMAFLGKDLQAHAAQPVKFIFSHRPSWLMPVALQNPDFPLHQLARRYGVQYVVAGHVHQILRFELQGVTYISMPSSGGHLRASREYKDGWFFAHTLVDVRGTDIDFHIEELKAPHGQGRVTAPKDWGMAGLLSKH